MRSTFSGMEIARRALFANQQALDTTGNNISNASTPGYSRQVVRLTETTPFAPPSFNRPAMPGMIGTGVEVSAIERMRDEFLDGEARTESQSLGRWQTQSDLLSEVELIFTEPSDSGIRSALDALWSSLQDLSVNPENGATRSVVRQRASAFADQVQSTNRQLDQLRHSVDDSIDVKVTEINRMAGQVAALNDQIVKATTSGLNPNDLKDQRDLILKDLAKSVNIGVVESPRGDVQVTIGGTPLVDGNEAREIAAVPDATNGNLLTLQWKGTGDAVEVSDGALRGLLDVRDDLVPGYQSQLDNLASAIITQVNAVHQAGYDLNGDPGLPFFVGTGASSIALNPAIDADGSLIAASKSGEAGDGENAAALAGLNSQKFLDGGTQSFQEYFQSLISKLGVDSQDASNRTANQQALLDHLETQQQTVSGVSLDEEMINMVKFQQGYNAAARLFTVMNEMIDTVINGLGLR